MPPFIPFPNVCQLNALYECNGQLVENVFHLQGGGAWTTTLLAAIASDYASWDDVHYSPLRCASSALVNTRVVDLTAADGVFDESTWDVSGGAAGASLPNNVSLAVKWLTGKRGRSFRGRTYVVGMTESQLDSADSQSCSAAYSTAIIAAMRAFLTFAWHNAAVPVVASRRSNNAPRLTGVATQILDAGLTDRFIDSQRRRLPDHNVHR